ncbi:MAG TPA: beta-ketoacyl-[acyl-carrier-protein] synthase II [Dehalococcoidia bacterium]|nr:beta-ketoacyl-[acyl-carrier-protein] synthase II [Dehalococcoidia bacterium]HIK90107.1 beta-ketoacyl-[acyl-carrier-protein] synthase II [Dehalococcoidia bacterium]
MTDRAVVTGIGLVTPVGSDRNTTWDSLLEGKSGVDYISLFDAEGYTSRIAAEVNDFDAAALLGRKEAKRLDRFAQFACVAALEALDDAGIEMANENADRVGVLIGSGVGGIITISDQHKILLNKGPKRVSPFLIPMMLGDMASGQVSMMIGAKGPNFSTVSACATGADSIGEALEMIRRGRADVVIAGGTEAAICEIGIAGFNSCMALSTRNDDPQGASRPFESGRDGFVLGEGAGLLVLESLEHAEKRGANVIAELAGYGASSDSHHVTQPHPEGEGAARAMKWALEDGDIDPESVDYINAHGTSTPMNDKFETIAMKRMFGDHAYKLAVSSTKSMTGHLLGAAGGIEAAFSALAVHENVIPPTINLNDPDPECDLNYTPNVAVKQNVDVAMSNVFGFGGHNASLVFKSFQQ